MDQWKEAWKGFPEGKSCEQRRRDRKQMTQLKSDEKAWLGWRVRNGEWQQIKCEMNQSRRDPSTYLKSLRFLQRTLWVTRFLNL